jgi:hypothetical protein
MWLEEADKIWVKWDMEILIFIEGGLKLLEEMMKMTMIMIPNQAMIILPILGQINLL